MTCHDMPWRAMACHAMAWHGMPCCGMAWHGMPWYAVACHGMPWHEKACRWIHDVLISLVREHPPDQIPCYSCFFNAYLEPQTTYRLPFIAYFVAPSRLLAAICFSFCAYLNIETKNKCQTQGSSFLLLLSSWGVLKCRGSITVIASAAKRRDCSLAGHLYTPWGITLRDSKRLHPRF